ncbi:hypothetical protein M513_03501, partial [Trichuris suis]
LICINSLWRSTTNGLHGSRQPFSTGCDEEVGDSAAVQGSCAASRICHDWNCKLCFLPIAQRTGNGTGGLGAHLSGALPAKDDCGDGFGRFHWPSDLILSCEREKKNLSITRQNVLHVPCYRLYSHRASLAVHHPCIACHLRQALHVDACKANSNSLSFEEIETGDLEKRKGEGMRLHLSKREKTDRKTQHLKNLLVLRLSCKVNIKLSVKDYEYNFDQPPVATSQRSPANQKVAQRNWQQQVSPRLGISKWLKFNGQPLDGLSCSRYFPGKHLDLRQTSPSRLFQMYQLARARPSGRLRQYPLDQKLVCITYCTAQL